LPNDPTLEQIVALFSSQNLFIDYDTAAAAVADAPGFDPDMTNIYLTNVIKKKDYTFIVNPAFTHAWGPFSIGFEAAFAWGKTSYIAGLTVEDPTTNPLTAVYPYAFDVDKYGYGLYFDADYNYGSGHVSFLFWLADGTNWNSDDSFHDAISLGDLQAFTVAFGYNAFMGGNAGTSLNDIALDTGGSSLANGILGSGIYGRGRFGTVGDNTGSNQWGIGLLGQHNVTDDISLNWGIGYFALVNPYAWTVDTGIAELDSILNTYFNRKKDLGWEIDIGASFQLLDNLTFETQFGYFFNGAAFDQIVDVDPDTGHAVWKKAKDTFSWVNVLTVSF
jgi:hypothetical protein